MPRVLTYGTFDLFHWGHVRLLQRARSLGSQLFVGLSTDNFNAIKGKQSLFTFEQRVEILESCRYVSQVFAETQWDQKISDITKYGIDIFVMGDDWVGKFDHLSSYCDVVYLERTPDISSTLVKSIARDTLPAGRA